MNLPSISSRLQAVEEVRALQRDWVKRTRQSVAAGGPFAICNGDEAEELFIAMDIPVLAINYWNYLILAQRKQARMNAILQAEGYPGAHFFGFALAASLSPEDAPWGGLPTPTIICGSSRNEMETRVCELWAAKLGCANFTMDFSFPSPPFRPLPREWWQHLEHNWEAMVDPARLDYRIAQERQLVARVEAITGRRLTVTRLAQVMALINEQMSIWTRAQQAIAAAPVCPVHIRDQISIYQAMWHRGSPLGVDLITRYEEEIRQRVDEGIGAYENERFRLYYSVQTPPWHDEIETRYGAVTVCCSYTDIPGLYRRRFDPADPLRALAARHMLLFDWGPYRIIDVARRHRCDAAIVVEPAMANGVSLQQQIVEAAGIPYLAIPRPAGDAEICDRIGAFIEQRLLNGRERHAV
ncbi:MAG: 2-hydroxyacyl-CoA dehydratase [Gammaproteobacteria bacterium]|nr:2-hydroxyacyl-CoA dehydratase [Gammaproteobacteria bacterium]